MMVVGGHMIVVGGLVDGRMMWRMVPHDSGGWSRAGPLLLSTSIFCSATIALSYAVGYSAGILTLPADLVNL